MTNLIKPLADRVLVETVKESDMKGGLYMPDTAKKASTKARVLAVGPGRRAQMGPYPDAVTVLIPLEVKVGDTVLVDQYSGAEVKVESKTYRLIPEGDILAILEPTS